MDIRKYKSTTRFEKDGLNLEGANNIFKARVFSKKLLSDKLKLEFYEQLASLIKAGIDIRTGIEIIIAELGSSRIGVIVKQIGDDLVKGLSLSESLRKTDHFSEYEVMSIRIGEETANLSYILDNLALYFKRKIFVRRQVISALTYPSIILVVAFCAIGFMLGFVVPMFGDIFRRFGSDLPAITKSVIYLSDTFKSNIWFLLILFSILTGVAQFAKRRKEVRLKFSLLSLKIPIFGELFSLVSLVRFTGTMAILTRSKLPLLDCLEFTKQVVQAEPIKIAIEESKTRILSGESLHVCLNQYAIFPRRLVALVKIGEETNQLELFFEKLTEQFSAEIEYKVSVLSKFIEPAIILILGVFVGVILVSMYLPLFKLGQTF